MKTKHCLAPLLSSDWHCPGCGTPLADCEKDIVLHHDHLEDEFRGLAYALDQKRNRSRRAVTVQDAGFIDFVLNHRRFLPVPLCSGCNARDGILKKETGVHRSFSFSPEQLSSLYQGSDEAARQASAVQAWKLYRLEYNAHLFASLGAWRSATKHYFPDRHFKYPSLSPLQFKGLETIVANLTYHNSRWVCRDALKLIRGPYLLTPSAALRKSFEKRRLYNTGKQRLPIVMGVKRSLKVGGSVDTSIT